MDKEVKSIGIFDSGLGGLTVAKEIIKQLPKESITYIGDTARVPYGSKSPETVVRFTTECVKFLETKNIKMGVIACNTASASGLDIIQSNFKFPVIGVVNPGALAAVKATKSKKVGVIGTEGTIKSKAYEKAIKSLDNEIEVYSKACPLFVPLVEEGWIDTTVTRMVIEEYLSDLIKNNIDTLVLGCTHYPIIKNTIKSVIGNDIKLVDSAEETALTVKDIVFQMGMLNTNENKPQNNFYVTDAPEKFVEVGEKFL